MPAQAQTTPLQDKQYQEPFTRIDERAKAVSSDEGSVRELADAVFDTLSISNISPVWVSPFKERCINAEISYRSGRREGIPERNIVRLINELVQKINAPEYSQTSEEEVRRLRMNIAYLMPHFIIQQRTDKEAAAKESGFTISPIMSPLEAIYITNTLIYQKRYNKEFQLSISEQARLGKTSNRQRQSSKEPQLTTTSSPRVEEMRRVFNQVAMLGVQDQISLINDSLNILGIEP